MQEENPLQRAISAARAGRELTARDMFLDIVKTQPNNEVAWMWLTGLLDDLDDCILACERTLEINPNNAPARKYLDQLLERKKKEIEAEKAGAEEQARALREALRSNNREGSLEKIRALTRQKYVSLEAWRMLAEYSTEMDEQIRALEEVLGIAPEDVQATGELKRLNHFRENPLDLAALYEEQGNTDKAIVMYSLAAQNPNYKQQWDQIYWKIIGLENLQQEKIAHVRPTVSIARLTLAPSLLFFVLLLVQAGINPFTHPEPVLWFGLPWVVLGGFMIALASVRSHNRLWAMLFKHPGASATPAARLSLTIGGGILVLLPYVVLFLSAIFRLMNSLPTILHVSN
jgi:tetratricopeptide (TPR) repeat protein